MGVVAALAMANGYRKVGNDGYWLSIDLHVHSVYSGGSLTPLEILNSAGAALLDAVAISDHNEVRGAIEGQIIAGTTPFLPLAVSSQEVSAGEHCHFLLVGSNAAQADVNRWKIPEVLRRHRERGGAVVLAHPWTAFKNGWFKGLCRDLVEEGLMDGVEVFNASLLELDRNLTAIIQGLWEEWLIPYRLAATGGSDYHYRNKGRRIGMGRTYLKVFNWDETGLLDALRNRRTVAGLFDEATMEISGQPRGKSLYLGQEPWFGELNELITSLRGRIAARGRCDSRTTRFLMQLIAAGHFQPAVDLLGY